MEERGRSARVTCPVFGNASPKLFDGSQLPTCSEVILYYLKVFNGLKFGARRTPPSHGLVAAKVAKKLEEIWMKASVPCVSSRQIIAKISLLHTKYRALLKKYSPAPVTKKQKQKFALFSDRARAFREENVKKLFDVCLCKCVSLADCSCPRAHKVPAREHDFLSDQRTTRRMFIGALDAETTEQLQRQEERRQRDRERLEQEKLKHQENQLESRNDTDIVTEPNEPEASETESQGSDRKTDSDFKEKRAKKAKELLQIQISVAQSGNNV